MPQDLLTAPVRKLYTGAKYDHWALCEPVLVLVSSQAIEIPAGYISDFASVPRWVPDWVIPRNGLSALPALGHDYLYQYAIVPRRYADDQFRIWLTAAGVPFWQVNLMYNYVRLFGWIRYGELTNK